MRKKRITLLFVSLAIIWGFSDNVLGQTKLTTPAPFVTAAGVNNAFGAGESATISGNNLTWPNGNLIATSPDKVFIGGNDNRNTVVRVYNGDGYGIGWISVLRLPSWGSSHHSDYNWSTYPYQYPFSGYIQRTYTPGGVPAARGADEFKVLMYTSPQQTTVSFHYQAGSPNGYGYTPTAATLTSATPRSYDLVTTTRPGSTTDIGSSAKMQLPIVYSFNSFNAAEFTGTNPWRVGRSATGTWIAPCQNALFASVVSPHPSTPPFGAIISTGSARIAVSHHNSTGQQNGTRDLLVVDVDPIDLPKDVYTSTRDPLPFYHLPTYGTTQLYSSALPVIFVDDGIELTQFRGNPMTNAQEMLDQMTPNSVAGQSGTWFIDNYQRPTTLAIAGTTQLKTIQIDPVVWAYQVNYVTTVEQNYNKYRSATYDHRGMNWQNSALGFQKTGATCNSGYMMGFAFDVEWDDSTVGGFYAGATQLDAAVQLLSGAIVCVEEDVTDNTGFIGNLASDDKAAPAAPNTQTNALIVLPVADRVTLRTKGDFQANMFHERDLSLQSANALYTAANFPDPDANIYMYLGTTTHAFATPHLNEFKNASITANEIEEPTDKAEASIFGVYGDYDFDGLMAEIRTTAASDANNDPVGKDDNPGVIEIGPSTAGKEYFHIYSGGILKNFEGCTTISNFTMNFGTNFGETPNFHLDGIEDLSILNYGNNNAAYCDANIYFRAGSMAAIEQAYLDASNNGAFRVQALSDVELREDGVIDATTTTNTGNNFYLLSDGGNVVTQKLDITTDYVDGIGQGLVTFWAEDRDDLAFSCENNAGNLNSVRGNIYLNDDVTINRPTNPAGVAETNLIAANNIRTASFTSISENDNDVLNIISRKGDIYLGYSIGVNVYDNNDMAVSNGKTASDNVFTYKGTGTSGEINIFAGYDDQGNSSQAGGGNIYFTSMDIQMQVDELHTTNILIPFSNQYQCTPTNRLHQRNNIAGSSMMDYEQFGIIGGMGRCGTDTFWSYFAGHLVNPGSGGSLIPAKDISLNYIANGGELILDAGARGNIINNVNARLNFQSNTGNAFFRTRGGDIDMRGQTTIKTLLQGQGVLFLADNGNPNKKSIDCECEEESNNVYIQDLKYNLDPAHVDYVGEGSLYFGADNNIKLQYGGLKSVGTWKDPFLTDGTGYNGNGITCGTSFHCDSDPSENKASDLLLNFQSNSRGGVGIVASDLIDIYKPLIYNGGSTLGMSPVPAHTSINGQTSPGGLLHGENVAGYGLYVKAQGNKNNWTENPFTSFGICGPKCVGDVCGDAFLHQVARVTFHDDARIYAENSKVYIGTPVLEVYGNLELNTEDGPATKNNQLLHIQTDSLIVHDSLILNGSKLHLTTWSNLERNMPVIKLGHQRFTPPQADDCNECFSHVQGGSKLNHTAVDTLAVAFLNGANLKRLHTLVADHTVLTFLTDYMDAPFQPPYIDAKFFVDTFKVRNQVEFWNAGDGKRDGHFELVSEIQMSTKSQAGVFARHLHMEPIAPDCSSSDYSELWLPGRTLNVISTSTFGGYGTVHNDVYVETQARIAPGYASLGVKGNCYEQKAGTLRMQNLSMDYGAELHYSIGNELGFEGEEADCIEVDHLLLRGDINVYVEERCGQYYTPGCYPIIRYNSVEDMSNLRNLKLMTLRLNGTPLRLEISEEGTVYLCVGETARPMVQRAVILPEPPPGVHMFPNPGVHYVPWGDHFTFTLDFEGREVLEVTSSRFDFVGASEILISTVRATGEHEYTLPYVKTQPVYIYIGPNLRGDDVFNESVDRAAVWSSGNTLHIRVAREDIATVYSIAGTLVTRIDVPEGGITLPLSRGAYIVTLKDGSVHKVIIR